MIGYACSRATLAHLYCSLRNMAILIADTNVWYEIGEGARDPGRLRTGGNTLVAIPTSILEIASPHSEEKRDTWPKRRKAAAAILEHADEITDDTENHLAVLWGLHPEDRGTIWHDVCEAVARSESSEKALRGVEDQIRKVKISLNVSAIQTWREGHWTEFKEDVVNAIEQHAPGYKLAQSEGRYTNLPKEKRAQFAADLHSPEVRRVFLLSTFSRALPSSPGSSASPTDEQIARASVSLAPYLDAYVEYIHGCATSFAHRRTTSVTASASFTCRTKTSWSRVRSDGVRSPSKSARRIILKNSARRQCEIRWRDAIMGFLGSE